MSAKHVFLIVAIIALDSFAAADSSGSQSLAAFKYIASELPWDGKIVVGSSSDYKFSWSASQDLTDILHVYAGGDNLYLDISNDHKEYKNSTNGVTGSYTVELPAGTQRRLTGYGISSITMDGAAISSSKYFGINRDGRDGGVFVTDVSSSGTIKINNAGSGTVAINGTVGAVEYTGEGATALYLNGASGTVDLKLRGAANANIDASDSIEIKGNSYGTGQVTYNKGTCSVTSGSGSSACKQSDAVSQPPAISAAG